MPTNFNFTPWVAWVDRNKQPESDKPGVYLIGRFKEQPPAGPANPLDKRVIYIGESAAGRQKGRWRSFARTAFKNTGKHGGGKKFKELFGDDSSMVYVSFITDEDLIREMWKKRANSTLGLDKSQWKATVTNDIFIEIAELVIKYEERRLILQYALLHGHRPLCNAD